MKLKKEKELELGKYLETDLIEISEAKEIYGGTNPYWVEIGITAVGWVSSQTCPTSACTRAC